MSQAGFVGFDTSNYTTSAAVCSQEGEVLANIRIMLPVKDGERGIRQSDAVFFHTRNLQEVCKQLKEAVKDMKILAVGCSAYPRSVENSYMPCFLAGMAAAESFSAALNLPVYHFSHQDGHIMAAAYSSGASERLLKGPFAAFHVSGGTTEMVEVRPKDYGFEVELLGGSADLHAGQAIDRAGVMMGLHFPCGKEMEALALENTKKVPSPRTCVKDGFCHFSGLENLSEKLWKETGDRALVSAYVLQFCGKTLQQMTEDLDRIRPDLPIVYAGGVMSNRYLQSVLSRRPDTYFGEPQFSADNAAGISLLCRRQFYRSEGVTL